MSPLGNLGEKWSKEMPIQVCKEFTQNNADLLAERRVFFP
jgi:hypothetical protein